MRVLITGGAGFLSSHLCDRLTGGGHTVVCTDNFVTGRPESVAHLLGHGGFTPSKISFTITCTSTERSTP